MGQCEKAWGQIYKILPLTHEKISTSPFIMSNSYVFDEERGYDGESMNDWFTGSGCVLIKILVWEVFGILPTLEGLIIRPCNYLPTQKASIRLKVKGCDLSVCLAHGTSKPSEFIVNGKKMQSEICEQSKTEQIFFSNEEIKGKTLEIFVR